MPQSKEITKLNPYEEIQFNNWAKLNNIPNEDGNFGNYDMRGYWKDIASKGQNETQVNSVDHQLHYPDTYKQHGHPTFSIESKYSTGPNDGGSWNGETFIPQKTNMSSKRLTQKEFADKLRAELPELAEFNDNQIVSKVLQLRPDLVDKVDNPMAGDLAASDAQARAERGSKSLVNPEMWDKHPTMKAFTQSVMQALPGAGAIGGGLLATPETMGGGTLLGGSLGAGIGRGAMDIGNQLLGLGETSPMEKARNIGVDTALTAVTPGLMTMAKAPIQSARIGAGMLSNAEDMLIPKGLRNFIKQPWLEDFAKGGNKVDPLVRPRGMQSIANEVITKPKIKFVNGKYIDTNTGEELTAPFSPSRPVFPQFKGRR